MNQILSDISEVFNIFHDGQIVGQKTDVDCLTLIIDCEYLAEIVDPTFERFSIELCKVSLLEFDPWMEPKDAAKRQFNGSKEIFTTVLSILSAEIENGCVQISCKQDYEDLNYSGGTLLIAAQSIDIKDQIDRTITLKNLQEVAERYWDSFNDSSAFRNSLTTHNNGS